MFSEIISSVKTILENSDYFNKVEPYEGQLEDIENFIIEPPTAFIDINSGNPSESTDYTNQFNLEVYLTASHMYGDSLASMYNLLENTIELLDKSRSISGCNVFFQSFQKLAVFPGFVAYVVNFKINILE